MSTVYHFASITFRKTLDALTVFATFLSYLASAAIVIALAVNAYQWLAAHLPTLPTLAPLSQEASLTIIVILLFLLLIKK